MEVEISLPNYNTHMAPHFEQYNFHEPSYETHKSRNSCKFTGRAAADFITST